MVRNHTTEGLVILRTERLDHLAMEPVEIPKTAVMNFGGLSMIDLASVSTARASRPVRDLSVKMVEFNAKI